MTGKKKAAKKKTVKKKTTKGKKTTSNQQVPDDLKSEISEISVKTTKTTKSARSTKSKKSAKKKSAPSVLSEDARLGLVEIKKGKKGKKSGKISKLSLSALQITDKKLPPTEVPKALKIPAVTEIDFKKHPALNQPPSDLTKIIESAAANSLLTIPQGVYYVQVKIKKPISIVGQGEVFFISPGNSHIINVHSDSVFIQGVKMIQKYSELHSCIFCEEGKIKITDCLMFAENTPAVIVAGKGVVHCKECSIVSQNAPSVLTTGDANIAIHSCDISMSNNSGVVSTGKSIVKISKSHITHNSVCGIISKEQSKLYCEQSFIGFCDQSGIEIGSTSNLTAVVSCGIEGCKYSGITIYGLATSAVSDTVITNCQGPAILCTGGSGVLSTNNKFSNCSNSLLFLQENTTVDSQNDSFTGDSCTGCSLKKNADISLTNSSFNNLKNGLLLKDESTTTISNVTFSNIKNNAFYSTGQTTSYISKAKVSDISRTGFLLSNAKKFEIENSTISKTGETAIDCTDCAEVILTNTDLKDNKKAGLVCTNSPTTITNGSASGNHDSGYEFRACKGTLKEVSVSSNKVGIYCINKGSCSIEKSNIHNNKALGIAALMKSAVTLRNSSTDKCGILIKGKSVIKLRNSSISNSKYGLQVIGSHSSADIEETNFNQCSKCAILLDDEAKLTCSSSNFLNNSISIQTKKKSTIALKSNKYSVTEGQSTAQISLYDAGESTIKKCTFSTPGSVAIFSSKTKSKIELIENTCEQSHVAGAVFVGCQNIEVNSGNYSKNGRAGFILSSPGDKDAVFKISKTKFEKNTEAAILITNKTNKPTITDISCDGKDIVQI